MNFTCNEKKIIIKNEIRKGSEDGDISKTIYDLAGTGGLYRAVRRIPAGGIQKKRQ